MDDDMKLGLTRRKTLMGLGTIGAAGATGAGAWARFTDTETKKITVKAGSLDLRVDGKNGVISVGHGPLRNGQCTDFHCEKLTNKGNVPGKSLSFEIPKKKVKSLENGLIDGEKDAGDESDKKGELHKYLKVLAFLVCRIDGEFVFKPIILDKDMYDGCVSDLSENYSVENGYTGKRCVLTKKYGKSFEKIKKRGLEKCVTLPKDGLSKNDECLLCHQIYFKDVPASDAMTDKVRFPLNITLSDHRCDGNNTPA